MGAPQTATVAEQRARVARMSGDFKRLRLGGGRVLAMVDLVLSEEEWVPPEGRSARELLRGERAGLAEVTLPVVLGAPDVDAFRAKLPTLTPGQVVELATQARVFVEIVRRSASSVLDELRDAFSGWRRVASMPGAPEGIDVLVREAKAFLVTLREIAGPRA